MTPKTVRLVVRLAISGVLLVIFLLHSAGWAPSRLLSTIENLTYDSRIALTLPGTVDERVVIIDIDEKSQAAEGQFPWPRDKLARLVTQAVDRYGVRVFAFDMTFPEPDRASGRELLEELTAGPLADLPGFVEQVPSLHASLDKDRLFAEAIRGRPVVLGYSFLPAISEGTPRVIAAIGPPVLDRQATALFSADFIQPAAAVGNRPELQAATRHAGFFDLPTLDFDGVIRDSPLLQVFDGQAYPALALETVRVALGGPGKVSLEYEPPEARGGLHLERLRLDGVTVPVDADVSVMVPYRGPQGSFPYVSATDVLNGNADPDVLRGAIAMFGTTAAGLKDLRATPVGSGYAGVEVHANIVSGILDGRIRQRAPYYVGMEAMILLAIGLLLAWVLPNFSPWIASLVTVGIIGVLTALAMALWSQAHLVMPLGVPIVFTIAVFVVQMIYGFFVETRRSREISRRFGEYVPPEIVEEMAANPAIATMSGDVREMTILFSDVRDFTSISETLKADELSSLMNQFLTPLTQVIHKHRGTIDKYMGDAIMAFWGAPLPDAEHPVHALEAAMAMVKALESLESPFQRRGWPKLRIGVGLTTGTVRVGDMGSEYRKAYTVMGDPVNLGSRLEGLTKQYGATIICSEFTRIKAPADWSFRELDAVRVKGRREPVAIYEPMGTKDALDPGLREDLARHRGALRLYRAQRWDQSEKEFERLARSAFAHPVYELFLTRIQHFREQPPGDGWDGVFEFTTK